MVLILADDITMVVTPAAVARSAAMSLVSIPPVPSAVPRDAVDTAEGEKRRERDDRSWVETRQ